ncbi:MAG: TauD/TfdA family dioxygenase [Pseudomonadales bacterium]
MKIQIDRENENHQIYLSMNEDKLALPPLWIRERSRCASQVDLKTKQRLFNPHLLPDDLKITQASANESSIHVTFSDGHSEEFDHEFLTAEALGFDADLPVPQAWVAEDKLPNDYQWPTLLSDEAHFADSVAQFLRYGYIILRDTPTADDSILNIASRYGYVRDTNFGRYFEVFSKPEANDLAYTPHAIGPHTDNPYRDPVPGIQLLHCLKNETSGGYSTLVDSLSVAAELKRIDPEGYQLLTKIAVRFRFFDSDTEHVAFHPLIELDPLGNIAGIHYSPRLDDLPLLPQAQLQQFQRARATLGTLLEDPRFEKKFKLEDGELMMFDNNRVLHGRTEFDPSEGVRHLQGCYIDRDGPKSLHRIANKN